MALGIRRKRSSQEQPPQQAAPPPAPAASNWTMPGDWREQLTASKPKGRFTQGENIQGYRR